MKDETRLLCQQSMLKGKVEITVNQRCPTSKLVIGSVLSEELGVELRSRNNNQSNSVSRNMLRTSIICSLKLLFVISGNVDVLN